jgi:hypothetical protein
MLFDSNIESVFVTRGVTVGFVERRMHRYIDRQLVRVSL